MITYPPMKLGTQLNIDDITDKQPLKKYLKAMADGDDDLFYDIAFDDHVLMANYQGEQKEFNRIVRAQWQRLYKWATGYEPEDKVLNRSNRSTVIDSLISMVMTSKWNKYKKVYQFDAELELALADVDEVKLPVKMLEKLPYKTFYLEFAKDGIFTSNFHGVFIDITRHEDSYLLYLTRVTHDCMTMSGKGVFNITSEAGEPCFNVKRHQLDGDHNNDPNGLRNDWEDFCFFMLNAIIYLCASNAEIRDHADTAKTYKPGKGGNKWSDLQKFECGYAFGETIRMQRKESVEVEKIASKDEPGNGDSDENKPKRSVRPHPVKASWQHYWVGKGKNKERVLRFKAEYFVGGTAKFATISRVI